MNKEEAKQLGNADDNNKQEESKSNGTNPLIAEYAQIGKMCKQQLDDYYNTIDTKAFTLSSNSNTQFKIQNKTFQVPTIVKYSSKTKHRSDPMIWYTETICPGNPKLIFESWAYPQYRLKWDVFVSSSKQITILPNIFLLHVATKPAAGGIISARDFVDLLNIFEVKGKTVQIASKSIVRKDIPQRKGFVRGAQTLSGVLFDRLEETDLEKYKLPKLFASTNASENKENEVGIEWTRVRYIVQSDIKGWIPQSVINTAMSSTNVGMMRDLRNYVINDRLKLK